MLLGFDGLFYDVGEAGGGVVGGFGGDELGAFLVDVFDGLLGGLEGIGGEDGGDLGESEGVVVAEVEGGDGGVEEIGE
ncbi:hypothetical protein COB72_08075 [bacterium]|nr:MAG: hypothetical protein COB72_08075 [bacterium]